MNSKKVERPKPWEEGEEWVKILLADEALWKPIFPPYINIELNVNCLHQGKLFLL